MKGRNVRDAVFCSQPATGSQPPKSIVPAMADDRPQPGALMRRLLFVCLLALVFSSSAFAVVRSDPFADTDLTFPALNGLASQWAERNVVVECPASLESWIADNDADGSWGYTLRDADWTRVKAGLCEAALAVGKPHYDGIEPW